MKLTELKNIGAEMNRKLNAVEIRTAAELRAVGSKEAFFRLQRCALKSKLFNAGLAAAQTWLRLASAALVAHRSHDRCSLILRKSIKTAYPEACLVHLYAL